MDVQAAGMRTHEHPTNASAGSHSREIAEVTWDVIHLWIARETGYPAHS